MPPRPAHQQGGHHRPRDRQPQGRRGSRRPPDVLRLREPRGVLPSLRHGALPARILPEALMSAPVPAYPVVYVDVAPDGCAHVNNAGRHEHFDSAPSYVTRRAVPAYATAVAAELPAARHKPHTTAGEEKRRGD